MDAWQGLTNLSVTDVLVIPSVQGRHRIIKERRSYGLSFSYGGKITYSLNGKRTVSDLSSAIFLPRGRTYRLFREESGDFPLINFSANENFTTEFLRISLRDPQPYLRDFEELRAAWLSGNNPAKVMSLFYGILSRLSEEEADQGSRNILAPSMEYLGKHLYDPSLCNEILAEQANISEVYFRKLFRDHYGQSPKQYILQARIRHAKHLLREQSATVTTISEACGFSSVYHFCRAFKQQTGLTPTEYESQTK
ncbi:MAG: helix-turn-helix transcriptional regulator [Clostridia bacterium]|nr:helix-turn-helix transcriptional regulator [Clostridia bacterium]